MLEEIAEWLIVHGGANDFTNNKNLFNNVKTIINKAKKTSHDTDISFSNITFRKDERISKSYVLMQQILV